MTGVPRTGAHLVVEALAAAGVRHVFSLSGNQILSLYDATLGHDLSILHTRHEAAAVHMADAWGRLADEPGVALVTAGPGHCNAVSALYGALMSESPVVLLSGHAPTAQLGRGAFQEMDQAAVAAPVTKASWTAKDASSLGRDIGEAVRIAMSGRPGPVHVSLPSTCSMPGSRKAPSCGPSRAPWREHRFQHPRQTKSRPPSPPPSARSSSPGRNCRMSLAARCSPGSKPRPARRP